MAIRTESTARSRVAQRVWGWLCARRWQTRAGLWGASPPRAPRGSSHLHQAQGAQWCCPAQSSGAFPPRQLRGLSRGYPGLPGDGRGRAGAGRVERGLESQLPPQPRPLLWRGRSQAPDFSFIPSHSFLRPVSDWLYLV